MNCKPNELAMIVKARTEPHLLGIVVRLTVEDDIRGFWRYKEEPTLIASDGHDISALRDDFLRPIRDQPGADETLTWAGKPATINQPKETA